MVDSHLAIPEDCPIWERVTGLSGSPSPDLLFFLRGNPGSVWCLCLLIGRWDKRFQLIWVPSEKDRRSSHKSGKECYTLTFQSMVHLFYSGFPGAVSAAALRIIHSLKLFSEHRGAIIGLARTSKDALKADNWLSKCNSKHPIYSVSVFVCVCVFACVCVFTLSSNFSTSLCWSSAGLAVHCCLFCWCGGMWFMLAARSNL